MRNNCMIYTTRDDKTQPLETATAVITGLQSILAIGST